MRSSSREADIEFETLVQELPKDLEKSAREFKALASRKNIRTARQLLRMVLQYCGIDKVLREVAGNMTLLGVRLTDTAVHKRLQAAGPWVRVLLKELLDAKGLEVPEGRRFVAVDASNIKAVGSKGTDYRVHLCIDLLSLEFVSVHITDHKTGETLKNYQFKEGDVVLADAAHCCFSDLADLVEKGADIAVRWNHAVPLYKRSGEELDLVAELEGQEPETVRTIPVLLKYTTRRKKDKRKVEGYIHILRLSEEDANKQKKKRERRYQRNGKEVSKRTLLISQFVIIFTTLKPEVLSGEDILKLYRVRWQIELAFKRLKSLINIDKLRTRVGSKLGELYLSGKLLYALLIERRMTKKTQQRLSVRLKPQERALTPWRILKMLKDELGPQISGSAHWQEEQWSECLHVMAERPRARKLQSLPTRSFELLKQLAAERLAA